MRLLIGTLILLPFAGLWWLTFKTIITCAKKGGGMRLLAAIFSLFTGGVSVGAGYFIGPLVGWFIIAVGGFIIIIGTWRSLTMTKKDVELQELNKEIEEEELDHSKELEFAKETANSILEQGEISNKDTFDWVCLILSSCKQDFESSRLLERLHELEKKAQDKKENQNEY